MHCNDCGENSILSLQPYATSRLTHTQCSQGHSENPVAPSDCKPRQNNKPCKQPQDHKGPQHILTYFSPAHWGCRIDFVHTAPGLVLEPSIFDHIPTPMIAAVFKAVSWLNIVVRSIVLPNPPIGSSGLAGNAPGKPDPTFIRMTLCQAWCLLRRAEVIHRFTACFGLRYLSCPRHLLSCLSFLRP